MNEEQVAHMLQEMTASELQSHAKRVSANDIKNVTPEQLKAVLAVMTPEQLQAVLRTMIEVDRFADVTPPREPEDARHST